MTELYPHMKQLVDLFTCWQATGKNDDVIAYTATYNVFVPLPHASRQAIYSLTPIMSHTYGHHHAYAAETNQARPNGNAILLTMPTGATRPGFTHRESTLAPPRACPERGHHARLYCNCSEL
jgi:hypothetical protein